jgi:transposase
MVDWSRVPSAPASQRRVVSDKACPGALHGRSTFSPAASFSSASPGIASREFLSFLKHLDANTPAELTLHLIADNYATHKHPRLKGRLAGHPRFHLHFTPTYSSWLD